MKLLPVKYTNMEGFTKLVTYKEAEKLKSREWFLIVWGWGYTHTDFLDKRILRNQACFGWCAPGLKTYSLTDHYIAT